MEVQGWDSFPWFVLAAPESVCLLCHCSAGSRAEVRTLNAEMDVLSHTFLRVGGFTVQASSWAGQEAGKRMGAGCVIPRTPQRKSVPR